MQKTSQRQRLNDTTPFLVKWEGNRSIKTLKTRFRFNCAPISIRLKGMTKSITLIQTIAFAGVFSGVSFWYGFVIGRESSEKSSEIWLKIFAVGTPPPRNLQIVLDSVVIYSLSFLGYCMLLYCGAKLDGSILVFRAWYWWGLPSTWKCIC
ncbi:putative membrane lipoprotein [Tripterygium wilfordii]|uniref:Putative membrane lipoprotein n=1 Tax=Tripterygium wilfordii TaxID=458696 RepID=A0A7J7C679_TRIWF|nr:uncharacterized protein LOC119987378 [Tripterygium wilfordii]KAF5729660.1 putative membrane lipoprotein [Tripterygium wilfordii]